LKLSKSVKTKNCVRVWNWRALSNVDKRQHSSNCVKCHWALKITQKHH